MANTFPGCTHKRQNYSSPGLFRPKCDENCVPLYQNRLIVYVGRSHLSFQSFIRQLTGIIAFSVFDAISFPVLSPNQKRNDMKEKKHYVICDYLKITAFSLLMLLRWPGL